MIYFYIKALHIIFVVTWFAGLFYIVRLFIYNAEANEKQEPEKSILQNQFAIMIKRLWMGITWPSAILTLIFGGWMLYIWIFSMSNQWDGWLLIKLSFVCGLYLYHFSLHAIYRQQLAGRFSYSSQQLRIWNEVATVFLIAVVMLVVVKSNLSFVWGLAGLFLFIIILMAAIKIYKSLRK